MADPTDPKSAASTFAPDMPGRGVVSDDAAAKAGGVRDGYETETEAQRTDGVDVDEQQFLGEASPPVDDGEGE